MVSDMRPIGAAPRIASKSQLYVVYGLFQVSVGINWIFPLFWMMLALLSTD